MCPEGRHILSPATIYAATHSPCTSHPSYPHLTSCILTTEAPPHSHAPLPHLSCGNLVFKQLNRASSTLLVRFLLLAEWVITHLAGRVFHSAALKLLFCCCCFVTFSLFGIINCGWCIRHGLDYLPPQSRLICVCLFSNWTLSLLAQCNIAYADPDGNFPRPAIRLCYDQSQSPSIPASPLDPHPKNRLCYDRSQLLSIQPSQLDPSLSSGLRELGIGFHLSSKRSCRGGKRKQHKISVVSGVRASSKTSNDVRRSPGTRSVESRHRVPVTDDAADVSPSPRTSYSARGASFANLIPVSVQALTATSFSKIIKVLYFNSQSCRQKASDVHEMILDDGIGILLMTETWLYAQGDEACIAEITPRCYVLRSFPRTGSRGGGIAFIVRDAFCDSTSFKRLSFQSFEAVELHISGRNLSISVVCLYRPLPAGRTKLSNQSFLQEFPEFITQFAGSHSDLVLIGDFNFLYDGCADTQV